MLLSKTGLMDHYDLHLPCLFWGLPVFIEAGVTIQTALPNRGKDGFHRVNLVVTQG